MPDNNEKNPPDLEKNLEREKQERIKRLIGEDFELGGIYKGREEDTDAHWKLIDASESGYVRIENLNKNKLTKVVGDIIEVPVRDFQERNSSLTPAEGVSENVSTNSVEVMTPSDLAYEPEAVNLRIQEELGEEFSRNQKVRVKNPDNGEIESSWELVDVSMLGVQVRKEVDGDYRIFDVPKEEFLEMNAAVGPTLEQKLPVEATPSVRIKESLGEDFDVGSEVIFYHDGQAYMGNLKDFENGEVVISAQGKKGNREDYRFGKEPFLSLNGANPLDGFDKWHEIDKEIAESLGGIEEIELQGNTPESVEEKEIHWADKVWNKGVEVLTNPNSRLGKFLNKIDKEIDAENAQVEIQKITQETTPKQKLGIFSGLASLGLLAREKKADFMASAFTRITYKDQENSGRLDRFFDSYRKGYQAEAIRAKKNREDLTAPGSWVKRGFKNGGGLASLVGNAALIGRFVTGLGFNPLRTVGAAAMVFGRFGEALKQTNLNQISKGTRIENIDEAMELALSMYADAQKKSGNGKVSAKDLEKIYIKNLPQEILEKLAENQNKPKWGAIAQYIVRGEIKHSIGRLEKALGKIENKLVSEEEKEKLRDEVRLKYARYLKEMELMVQEGGQVDLLAYGSKILEEIGKKTAAIMAIETLAEGVIKSGSIFANFIEDKFFDEKEIDEKVKVAPTTTTIRPPVVSIPSSVQDVPPAVIDTAISGETTPDSIPPGPEIRPDDEIGLEESREETETPPKIEEAVPKIAPYKPGAIAPLEEKAEEFDRRMSQARKAVEAEKALKETAVDKEHKLSRKETEELTGMYKRGSLKTGLPSDSTLDVVPATPKEAPTLELPKEKIVPTRFPKTPFDDGEMDIEADSSRLQEEFYRKEHATRLDDPQRFKDDFVQVKTGTAATVMAAPNAVVPKAESMPEPASTPDEEETQWRTVPPSAIRLETPPPVSEPAVIAPDVPKLEPKVIAPGEKVEIDERGNLVRPIKEDVFADDPAEIKSKLPESTKVFADIPVSETAPQMTTPLSEKIAAPRPEIKLNADLEKIFNIEGRTQGVFAGAEWDEMKKDEAKTFLEQINHYKEINRGKVSDDLALKRSLALAEYMENLKSSSNAVPLDGETIEDYIKRASGQSIEARAETKIPLSTAPQEIPATPDAKTASTPNVIKEEVKVERPAVVLDEVRLNKIADEEIKDDIKKIYNTFFLDRGSYRQWNNIKVKDIHLFLEERKQYEQERATIGLKDSGDEKDYELGRYINKLMSKTGLAPKNSETVEDFIKRLKVEEIKRLNLGSAYVPPSSIEEASAVELDRLKAEKLGIDVSKVPPEGQPYPTDQLPSQKAITSETKDGPHDLTGSEEQKLLEEVRRQIRESAPSEPASSSNELYDAGTKAARSESLEEALGLGLEKELEAMATGAMSKELDEIYGKKTFLGIGKSSGFESKYWKNVRNINIKIFEDFYSRYGQKEAPITPFKDKENDQQHKLYQFVQKLRAESNTKPLETETVDAYVRRALKEALAKLHHQAR